MSSFNPNLFQLGYTSKSKINFDQPHLLDLLTSARKKNAQLSITGMLLFKEGTFLQILEGPKENVEGLFTKIKQDPKHHHVLKIFENKPGFREFQEWQMGFYDLNQSIHATAEGYTTFLQKGEGFPELNSKPKVAQKLLLHFRNR